MEFSSTKMLGRAFFYGIVLMSYATSWSQAPIRYTFSVEHGLVVSAGKSLVYNSSTKTIPSLIVSVPIEITNGITVSDKYFVGIGTGFQFAGYRGFGGLLPFYAEFRYVPIGKKASAIISQKLGGVLWATNAYDGGEVQPSSPVGIYSRSGIGIRIPSTKKISWSIILYYQMCQRKIKVDDYFTPSGTTGSQIMHFVGMNGVVGF